MDKRRVLVRAERIIIAALFIILVSEIAKNIWPLPATDSESANAVRNFIAQKSSPKYRLIDGSSLAGYFLLSMSLVSTGIRCLRMKWKSIKGIILTVTGLLICLYHLGEIETYKSVASDLEDIKRPNIEIIKFRAEQENLPLKTSSKMLLMYAHDKYLYYGEIVTYMSGNGENKSYEPTTDDIKFRNLMNNTKTLWDYNKHSLPILFKWWIAVGITGLILGFFTPIRDTPPSTIG